LCKDEPRSIIDPADGNVIGRRDQFGKVSRVLKTVLPAMPEQPVTEAA